MPRVFIPSMMRELTGGVAQIDVEAETVRQVIAKLDILYPGFSARVLRNGAMTPGLAVSIDGAMTPSALWSKVQPTSEVHFLPAIAGG
jgi:sulfur-carrier protein